MNIINFGQKWKNSKFQNSKSELYLKDFNFKLPNWIDLYFFNKVSDFFNFGLTVLILIIFVLFYKKCKNYT